MPSSRSDPRTRPGTRTLVVDRVACTGHGICATLLDGDVELDEWGYPIVVRSRVDENDGRRAVAFCPARALRLA